MNKNIIESADSSKNAQIVTLIISLFIGLITSFFLIYIVTMIIQVINDQIFNKYTLINLSICIVYLILLLKFNITFFLDFLSYNYVIEFHEDSCEYKFYILRKLIYSKIFMVNEINNIYMVKRKYINITDRPIIIITFSNKLPITLNTLHLTINNNKNLKYNLKVLYHKEIRYVTGIRAFLFKYLP